MKRIKRAVVIVLDGAGAGWQQDAEKYGDYPCHRVVNREGRVAEAFVFGGGNAQRTLLENEGIIFEKDGRIDLKKYQM